MFRTQAFPSIIPHPFWRRSSAFFSLCAGLAFCFRDFFPEGLPFREPVSDWLRLSKSTGETLPTFLLSSLDGRGSRRYTRVLPHSAFSSQCGQWFPRRKRPRPLLPSPHSRIFLRSPPHRTPTRPPGFSGISESFPPYHTQFLFLSPRPDFCFPSPPPELEFPRGGRSVITLSTERALLPQHIAISSPSLTYQPRGEVLKRQHQNFARAFPTLRKKFKESPGGRIMR